MLIRRDDATTYYTSTATMGSIEVYDQKLQRWVPYVPDVKKWEQHFIDISEGRAHPDRDGRYIVGSGASKISETTADLHLVTPVAQSIEMAKAELAQSKVIRKGELHFNQID